MDEQGQQHGGPPPGWVPPPGQVPPQWGPVTPPPGQPQQWGQPQPQAWGQPQQWAPPQKRKRFGWLGLFGAFMLGGITATIVVIGGIVLIGQAVGPPDSISNTHPPAEEGAEVAKVGDCLEGPPSRAVVVDRSQVVDCDELHGSEVTAVIVAPGERTTPGEDPLATFVDESCTMAFEDYVGSHVLDSDLKYAGVAPDDQSWADHDRRIWCLADTRVLGSGEGSVRGTHR